MNWLSSVRSVALALLEDALADALEVTERKVSRRAFLMWMARQPVRPGAMMLALATRTLLMTWLTAVGPSKKQALAAVRIQSDRDLRQQAGACSWRSPDVGGMNDLPGL